MLQSYINYLEKVLMPRFEVQLSKLQFQQICSEKDIVLGPRINKLVDIECRIGETFCLESVLISPCSKMDKTAVSQST